MKRRVFPAAIALLVISILCSVGRAGAQTAIYQYDPVGDLIGSFDVPGLVTSMTYDGGSIALADAGQMSVSLYDPQGQLQAMLNTQADVISLTYNPTENEIVVGDANRTISIYDSTGNLLQTIGEQGAISQLAYDSRDNELIAGVQSAGGQTSAFFYDSNGQLVNTIHLAGDVTALTYDSGTGQLIAASNQGERSEVTAYDSNGSSVDSVEVSSSVGNALFDPNQGDIDLIPGGDVTQFYPLTGDLQTVVPIDLSQSPNLPSTGASTFDPVIGSVPGSGLTPIVGSIFLAYEAPESKSLALLAPGLLLLAGLGVRRTIKRNLARMHQDVI